MDEAIFYRDSQYGALALIRRRGGLEVIDHGFMPEHLDAALAVLERHGREGAGNLWRLTTHTEAVLSSINAALLSHGYTYDPLDACAVLSVSEGVARRPDLPCDRQTSISETVSRWADGFLGLCGGSFGVTSFQRQARDEMRRPLPFLRCRALLGERSAADACAHARRVLEPLGDSLVRVSVRDGVLEVAIAPTLESIRACERTELPTFAPADIVGEREAVFTLGSGIEESDVESLAVRFKACAAATRCERRDENTVAVSIPATYLGDYEVDPGFRHRTAWLMSQLEPWSPELDDVGAVSAPD